MTFQFQKSIRSGKGFHMNLGSSAEINKGMQSNTNTHGDKSAKSSQTLPADQAELKKAIKTYYNLHAVFTVLIVASVLLLFIPWFVILLIASIAGKILFTKFRKVKIEYEMDEVSSNKFGDRLAAWTSLNDCKKIWFIIEDAQTIQGKSTEDAANASARLSTSIATASPDFLKVNADLIMIPLQNEKLFLLPDMVLHQNRHKVISAANEDISLTIEDITFVENSALPPDATAKGSEWQYVNPDGSPDTKRKNNRELPICTYSLLHLSSPSGINVKLLLSNTKIAQNFVSELAAVN